LRSGTLIETQPELIIDECELSKPGDPGIEAWKRRTYVLNRDAMHMEKQVNWCTMRTGDEKIRLLKYIPP